jgi:hypothetical protein
MSMLMLAVVAFFPITLLAILLLTSGLEGKFVSSDEDHPLASANQPTRRPAQGPAAAPAPAATELAQPPATPAEGFQAAKRW